MSNDRFKFRAWDKKLNKWLSAQEICESGQLFFFGEPTDDYVELEAEYDIVFIQSTGLKDKNGKLIYENDLFIDDWGNDYMIDFRYGSWVAVHKPKTRAEQEGEPQWDYLYDFLKPSHDIEIIGNIYENPELLEQ